MAAWEVSGEESETETDISKLADLKKLAVKDGFTFCLAFKGCDFQAIGVGGSAINLLDLAQAAIDVNRRNRERTTTDEETWQLLFNIIANLLVFGLKPLRKTVEALRLSKPSASDTSAANLPRPGKEYQPSATDRRSEIADDEKALGKLTQSMCSWTAEDDSSPLIKVCSYYDKLRTVDRYDEMTKPGNEDRTKTLLEGKGIEVGQGKKKVSTAILRYICQQSRKQGYKTTVGELSVKISNFRPVCALVKAFGRGVLVLLGANPQKFLNMVGRRSPRGATYFKHERLRDVAMSLRQADRNEHHGQLRALFIDLRDKVLNPALHFRKHKKTDGWSIDKGRVIASERVEIGGRIPFILDGIKSTSACSGDISTQAGERPLKRRTTSSGMEQAAEGGQCANKRTKLM